MINFPCPEPGIYFQYDEAEYHAIPALGSTNIKHLLCNPVVFYANSWMNPLKKAVDTEEESFAKIYGSASHARVLEGRNVFHDQYAPKFEPSDYPEALETTDDIRCHLRELKAQGHDVRLSGNKPYLIEQVEIADPEQEIIAILQKEYEQDNKGKTFLPEFLIQRIECAAYMIEKHPQLSKCFTGGYPEVTIIWPHADYPEIMCKARIDYLKIKAFVDYKTFLNKFGKPTERAIYGEMANYKYHIQGTWYWDGIEAAVGFAKNGQAFGDYDEAWLKKFSETTEFELFYVFQQKGPAPIARGKRFKRGSVYQCGVVAIQQAIESYQEYIKHYGSDQWVDMTPITDFQDDEFPVYTVEI